MIKPRTTIAALAAVVALTAAVPSCKPTEANYRRAYERAVADSTYTGLEGTIYAKYRNRARQVERSVGNDTFKIMVNTVWPSGECGTVPEQMKRFNVIVGGFKQLFNAKSLRQRLAENGYPGAYVLVTPEPYYYVAATGAHELATARADCLTLTSKPPFALRETPFILQSTASR